MKSSRFSKRKASKNISPFLQHLLFLPSINKYKTATMNLHEYQGKEILNSFGVEIQRGIVATTPKEAVEAAKKLTEQTGTGWHVIKAQVHAGGRVHPTRAPRHPQRDRRLVGGLGAGCALPGASSVGAPAAPSVLGPLRRFHA